MRRCGGAGTAHCDCAHPQNLLRVGSALLDAANKRHWELIQQTEGGTAWLLQHYEAYASALAQNMRHTYLSPFTIVTPNIGETGAWIGGRLVERSWQGWLCWGLARLSQGLTCDPPP